MIKFKMSQEFFRSTHLDKIKRAIEMTHNRKKRNRITTITNESRHITARYRKIRKGKGIVKINRRVSD